LLDAAQTWARQAFGERGTAAHATGTGRSVHSDADGTQPVHQPGHQCAAQCTWCPVCRIAALVRGDDPETAAKLVAAAGAVADALRSVLQSGGSQTREDGAAAEPRAVHPIQLDEE
jgi:hypothetical protein